MAELAVSGDDFLYEIESSVLLMLHVLRFALTLKVHNTAAASGFTNSGVKPRRSGRGYKPRKPGADFI